jgi:branched-chain amino acid transport system ATP-binding protein
MEALNIISAEHRGMWRLASALDSLRREMQETGSRDEAATIAMILHYLQSYADQVHHPKEDQYLFRVLRQRNPEAEADIAHLELHHREAPKQLESLQKMAHDAERGNSGNEQSFFAGLEQFANHLRDHIRTEEATVMPLAKKSLTPQDWQEIDAAFLANDDPLFGVQARGEFEALRARIVLLAPESVGLGGAIVSAPQAPADKAAPTILEVKGLTSHYGRIQALRGLDIEVREGQLVALVGANGAGKTTLLRALSGVQPASGGEIHFRGEPITRLRPDKRVRLGICQVPEGRQVFGPMTIEDNLRLGAYTRHKADLAEDMEKSYALFPILKEKRALPEGTLSGGQQQMLAMARALMGRPKLLLLDEPSMGLAPLLIEEIFRVVKALKAQGITIFLVEQNAHAALSIADVGYVLETGNILLSGPGKELLQNEQVKRAYLGM